MAREGASCLEGGTVRREDMSREGPRSRRGPAAAEDMRSRSFTTNKLCCQHGAARACTVRAGCLGSAAVPPSTVRHERLRLPAAGHPPHRSGAVVDGAAAAAAAGRAAARRSGGAAAGANPKPKPKPKPRPRPKPNPTPSPNATGSTDAWRGGSRAAIKHKAVCVHPTRSSSTLQPYVTRAATLCPQAATLCGPGERQLQRVLAAGASGCGPASADVAEPPRSMVKVP